MNIDSKIRPADLTQKINRLWELSAQKITAIQRDFDHTKGSPVFTVGGR